jgi:ectoine hydroxylase-related dioxygenase (phytanoyl-CoA dioxygenase family)
MQSILSHQQKQQFIDDGFVVVRGLISPEVAKTTHDAILAHMVDPANQKYSHAHASTRALWGAGPLTEVCRDARVEQVVTELVGPHLPQLSYHTGKEAVGLQAEESGYIPVLTMPTPHRASLDLKFIEPQGWHVDGIRGTAIKPEVLMLVIFAYLNDVPEYGGATTVKPGSHRQLFEHWVTKGEMTPIADLNDKFAPSLPLPGKAGDVIFFHYLLVHSGSDNLTENIRVGVNTAVHQLPEQPYQLKLGAPDVTWTPLDYTLRTDNLNLEEHAREQLAMQQGSVPQLV